MKNRYYSLPCRTAMFFVALFSLVCGVFSGVASCFLASRGAYTLSQEDMLTQGFQEDIVKLAPHIAGAYAQEVRGALFVEVDDYPYFYNGVFSLYPQYYYTDKSNYRYTIRNTRGETLKSNYKGEEYLAVQETLVSHPIYLSRHGPSYFDQKLMVTGYVLEDMEVDDDFSYYYKVVDSFYAHRVALIALTLVCLVVFISVEIYLINWASKRPGMPGAKPSLLDRIPTDLFFFVLVATILGLLALFFSSTWWKAWVQILVGGASLAIVGTMLTAFLMSIAARLQFGRGYWWKQSILGWCTKGLRRGAMLLPFVWRWILIGTGILCVSLFVLGREHPEKGLLLLSLITFVGTGYLAWSLGSILKTMKQLGDGDLNATLNPKHLYGMFRQMAQELNNVGQGAKAAAEHQLQAERMKTELITNVSHDIKTPLTSIVSYVDLLQKPHTQAQEEEYLAVLSRQSLRLKKLTEDLVEMSKAASGNITVDLQPTDPVELVNQALAEYQEKMKKAGLTVVCNASASSARVLADGKLLWRVMDNLLGNCVKYAMPGTRVYLNVVKFEKEVMLSVNNISRTELNIPAEELMGRFVRAERFRNTEGSGLGLDIAKTLMELQRGSLSLEIDGDLFKAILGFRRIPEPVQEEGPHERS